LWKSRRLVCCLQGENGQGRDNSREFLKENPDLAIEIENKVRESLHSSSHRRSSQSTPTPPIRLPTKAENPPADKAPETGSLRTAGGTADFYMHRARVRPASARRAGAVLSRALGALLRRRVNIHAESWCALEPQLDTPEELECAR
jgi:hypothetical protein